MLVPTFLATFRWGHRGSQSGLGLTQYSVRHTHLALTAQRIGDFLLRGLPRMLWSPSSFEGKGKRGVHGTGHQFQQLLLHSVICRRCGARANRDSHLFLCRLAADMLLPQLSRQNSDHGERSKERSIASHSVAIISVLCSQAVSVIIRTQ